MNLRERCHDPELMDDFSIGGAEVDAALSELRIINRYLGGAASSLSALKPLLGRRQAPVKLPDGRRAPVKLLDLGGGGADVPIAVVEWCRKRGIPIEVDVIDLGRDACRFACRATADHPEIRIVRANVMTLPFEAKSFDIAHCSLFLHHFRQDDIARILTGVAELTREAIVINDLHRHVVAYEAIRFLTRLFSRSRLVRYDAPLSVRRAFRRADLDDIQRRCRFPSFDYRWRWAFRYVCLARLTP